jgi:hypothetical protein
MEDQKVIVSPAEWKQMTVDQLITQKSLMIDRYSFLASKGYIEPSKMMIEGIAKLDSLILNN